MLHILVQPPEGETTYCGGVGIMADDMYPDIPKTPTSRFPPGDLQHTPSKSVKELDHTIQEVLEKCRRPMQELLAKAGDVSSIFPSWELDSSANKRLAKHISELRIPTVANKPSLLLHGLGKDQDRNTHIEQTFLSGRHTCVT
jgi:hypothetical protein